MSGMRDMVKIWLMNSPLVLLTLTRRIRITKNNLDIRWMCITK